MGQEYITVGEFVAVRDGVEMMGDHKWLVNLLDLDCCKGCGAVVVDKDLHDRAHTLSQIGMM